MWLFILLSSLLGSVFPIADAWALEQTYPSVVPISPVTTLPELIKIVFNFSLGISALLLFAMLCLGGILFLISAGDPAKQRRAKERLGSAALGSILLLTSYLAANIFAPELLILKPTGIPGISLTRTPLFAPQCSDGIDNDGDGKIDWNGKDRDGDGIQEVPPDQNCQSAADESEFLVECSDGTDNDGDGKIDFPADPQCKELSSVSESLEYECVASNDPDSGIGLPEITESFPLVTRAKQALATLDTIRILLKDVRDRSLQIAQVETQSVCQSDPHDHGFDHCHGSTTGPCGESVGCHDPRGDASHQERICSKDEKGKSVCWSVCVTDRIGPSLRLHHHYDWSCHRAGGKWGGGGQSEDVGTIPPTSTPSLAFINETINKIDHEASHSGHDHDPVKKGDQPPADAYDIKRTLEALSKQLMVCEGYDCKVENPANPPYDLILPRPEDDNFLLSLETIEYDLKKIRDSINICARTPNQQVATCKNVFARGVDTEEKCPDENDFVCLFAPGTK